MPSLELFLILLALILTLVHAATGKLPLWPAVFVICLVLLVAHL